MKKKLSFILAICLVLPCAILMTACSKKAYSVSGKTFAFTENVLIEWKNGVTDAEKTEYLKEMLGEGATEEKAIEELKKELKESPMTLTFNEDGSVVMKLSYKSGDETKTSEYTYYYSQSDDKKEIKLYTEKDYTADTETDKYILFRDGSFYMPYGSYDADATANILVELKKQ